MRTSVVLCMLAIAAGVCDGQWVQALQTGGTSISVSGTNAYANGTGKYHTFWFSSDAGMSWATYPGPPHFQALAVRPNGASGMNLFAAYDGVYLSTDNGASWTAIGMTDTIVYALVVSGINLFAGTYDGGVFLSTNDGTSWTAVNTGLTDLHIQSLAISGTNIFAGPARGVFLSTNNGTRWTSVGLTEHWVNSLAVCDSNLLAGTGDPQTGYLGGIWRRPLSEMITDVGSEEQLPARFSLSQNYPNPFNPTTNIKYQIPNSNHVTLKVYDVLGRDVATLVNEVKEPGTYMVHFDGSGLSSGVYFYRLTAGDFQQTRSMIVLK